MTIKITTHLEACILNEDKVVSTPLGDYSGLPWLAKSGDQAMDIHFENAYLGEEVLASPFQNENMILGKGVHLHWIVPPFLGKEYDGKLNAAPNRWLVEKNNGQQWLVISDYVHEVSQGQSGVGHPLVVYLTADYSVYPVSRSVARADGLPPFCYLGRHFPVGGPLPSEKELADASFQKRFGQPLTVLGFGHVQFSAFYPNCKTVFGFHDPEGRQGDTYNIIGWHALEEDDLVRKAVQAEKGGAGFDLAAFLEEKFGIHSKEAETTALDLANLSKTLYVASIKMDGQPEPVLNSNLKLAVGNTASEAFSALIAHEISPSQPISKIRTEDQLEYFLMNAQMDGHLVDQVPKFLEARHRKGFYLEKGGSLFAFQAHFLGKTQEFEGFPLGESLYDALNQLNEIKQQRNESEHELESLKSQLYADWFKYMRAAYPPLGSKDLFPDRDDIAHLLQTASLPELEAKEKEHSKFLVAERCLRAAVANAHQAFLTEQLTSLQDGIQELEADIAAATSPVPTDATNRLRIAKEVAADLLAQQQAMTAYLGHASVRDALQLLEERDAEEMLDDPATLNKYLAPGFPDDLLLKEIPEPPFWTPTEPVIAVDGFKFGSRPAVTTCGFGTVEWEKHGEVPLPKLEAKPDAVMLSKLDWCPFFMEWAVGLEDAPVSLTGKGEAAWAASFFSGFYLDNDSPGVYRNANDKNDHWDSDAYFQGGVILSPFMREPFVEGMEKYMAFCDAKREAAPDDEKQTWADKKALADTARTKILGKDLLCQRLSGFNSACLMFRQVPQLEMEEPLGFESSVAFSRKVAARCKGHQEGSPSSLFDFLPIRNGKLAIQQLRFLDNFGRAKDVTDFSRIITADTLTSEELRRTDNIKEYKEADIERLTREVFLPPRLTQAARLNFHFLENGNERLTDNPNTSPVCGWFVPNFLDETLMVFAANGQALGTLEKETGWQSLPWEAAYGGTYQDKVTDTDFLAVIQKILDNEAASGGTFIDAFLSALQDGLANIAPSDFALQNARILLMGRPIAVAKVRAGLQIKGFPALDQSWQATLLDVQKTMPLPEGEDGFLKREDRFTGQWNKIELPFRLGEHVQLNDGLLGYWVEKEDGNLSEQFYAPQINGDDSDLIASYGEGYTADKMQDNRGNPFIHKLKPDGEALTFTVLLDPRGVLHATTGVLPTELVSIPSELYQPALERMRMWFETGPVLHYERPQEAGAEDQNPPARRFFDLPDIPGHQWKWFENSPAGPELLDIGKPMFDEIHDPLPEIKKGYLILDR